ncbi:cytochrome b5 domain-containing protein [Candidatus Bathyarchaeota archaeon]|nr:cytochrome b5 domain-containing protein [Candidatus Bathyarchaeota archaeon]
MLTPEELAGYDGTDPSKPIYLAINGTIYDVTPGARIYGPGGSYHWFAGCDASRAYVTGCFADDTTPDMRGVDEMFLPLEDAVANAHFSEKELAEAREEERAAARKKVEDALGHWVGFFAKSDKYKKVGSVKREEGWLKDVPRRELCEQAQKGRKPRKAPEGKA